MEHSHADSTPTRSHARGPLLLVAGDAVSFLVFAAVGRSSHGEAAGLDALIQVAATAAPFALGWWLVAPFVGAYRVRQEEAQGWAARLPSSFLARTLLAWVLALPVGLALRALFLQRGIPLSFAIVTFIANTILLLGWRGVFLWLWRRHG
jgi:hypothetical protein